MFSSRTDKAHSQGGVQFSSCRCEFCKPRKIWARTTEKIAIKREIDATLLDLMGFDAPRTEPGLKRIAACEIEARREAARVSAWEALENERLANLARIEAAFAWREVALSDCEHGCKLYERTNNGVVERQVQHSSVYGCRNTDGPIQRVERIEFAIPAMPVRRYAKPRGFVPNDSELRRNRSANLDVESPSLHHMAKARAKALGL